MSSLTSAEQRTNSVQAAARRAAGWPLALICAAQFVLQLDFSIVNIALPSIRAELHVTAASLQWIITGYALTYGSLLLTGGRIGDLAGHRRTLLAELVLFGLTSLAAGLATSFVVLVVARSASRTATRTPGGIPARSRPSARTAMERRSRRRSASGFRWRPRGTCAAPVRSTAPLRGGLVIWPGGWVVPDPGDR